MIISEASQASLKLITESEDDLKRLVFLSPGPTCVAYTTTHSLCGARDWTQGIGYARQEL